MAFITKASIQEVNDKLDAVAVVSDYVRLENKGGRYWGLCPFHNEKTGSFTVNPDLKVYHCFGCGKGGSVINFVMEMDKLSFPETIELLAKRFGVGLVYENAGEAVKEDGRIRHNEEFYELYRRVNGSFQHFLLEKPEGKTGLDYLLARGISREMIEKFRLGYAPANRNWLHQFLLQKGYSAEFLAETGLFSEKYPKIAFYSGRIMIPIADRQGRIIAFGGRILSGEGPKYINSRDSVFFKKGQTLFAVDIALPQIRKTKEAYIAEGYMDVISLHQAGITNAVAPLGTAFTDEQAKLLRRWAEHIHLFFDSDDAGQKATVKGIITCRNNGLSCSVVAGGSLGGEGRGPPSAPKTAKDSADILLFFGPEVLKKYAESYILDFEYLIARSKTLFDIGGSEGKAKAVAFMFPYLNTLESEVSRDACIGAIADAFQADRAAVLHDYRRSNSHSDKNGEDNYTVLNRGDIAGGKGPGEEFPQNARPIRMNEELFLLTVVSVNIRLYPQFRVILSIKEIEDPAAKELFVALEECYINDEAGMDNLLSRISSSSLRSFITERSSRLMYQANPEKLIADGVKRVKQKRLEGRLTEIVKQIRITKNGTSGASNGEIVVGLDELLAEKMHIDAELRRLKEVKE
ncbi:MAG: DNA primase [Treponema sp.]|jgi:DNA primase|nr:DNA primase [Treponema sp.]